MRERQPTGMKSIPSRPGNPYIGLRPYHEGERSLFFGRDKDRKIFVDMILANRLTLLFAASGVGKSSLLQAAVLPQLKDPAQENLDAVYCNNWAGNPIRSIRDATLKALAARGRIDLSNLPADLQNEPLLGFFEFLSHFVRYPLVIVLDQFEEFFHYHRASQEFAGYRNQLVEIITDRTVPLSLVLSMREDFALALNAFKPEIPTVLFNNFYRLEKLPRNEAETAIVQPAAQRGYAYEPELLVTLLTDLAAREQRLGTPVAETALYIEPPYLQIICSQLFDLDSNDPEQKLRLETYDTHGRARGLLSSYIGRVTTELSYAERKLASKCFSYLVTRRGTKVAHTAESLARELREETTAVGDVLQKLEDARLLRSQSQDQRTWYELYHDLFSESVEEWNERFKAKERARRTALGVAAFLLTGLALFAAYNAGVNARNHHLRLSIKAGPQGQVEIHRGQAKTLDLFKLQHYEAETGITRQDIEPDQLFDQRHIFDLKQFDREWAEHLSAEERMRFYRSRGELPLAFEIARDRLASGNDNRAEAAIDMLKEFKSKRSYDEIVRALKNNQNQSVLRALSNTLGCDEEVSFFDFDAPSQVYHRTSTTVIERQSYEFTKFLYNLIQIPQNRNLLEVAKCLALFEQNRAIPAITKVLLTAPIDVQDNLASVLWELDLAAVIKQFISIYHSAEENTKVQILELFAHSQKFEIRQALLTLLKEATIPARIAGLTALQGQLKNTQIVDPFLYDANIEVAIVAASALTYPASPTALQRIRVLKEQVRLFSDPARKSKYMTSLNSVLARLDPKSPDAERKFAALLRSRWSSMRSPECAKDLESLLELDASPNILELTLTLANASAQQFIIKCAPDQVLLKKISVLSKLALSADPKISGTVLQRLLSLQPEAAFITLQQMTESNSYDRQKAAIQIVRSLRSERAYAILSELVNRDSASIDIRLKTLAAMSSESTFGIAEGPFRATIGAQIRKAIKQQRENSEFRSLAANALAAWLGEAAIPDLQLLLGDGESVVRHAAVKGLLAIGRPSASSVLRRAAAQGQTSVLQSTEDLINIELPLDQPRLVGRQMERFGELLRRGGGVNRAEWTEEVIARLRQLSQVSTCDDIAWLQPALDATDRKIKEAAFDALDTIGRAKCRMHVQNCLSLSEDSSRHSALLTYLKLSRASDLAVLREHFDRFPYDSFSIDDMVASLALPLVEEVPFLEYSLRNSNASNIDGRSSAKPIFRSWESQGVLIWSDLQIPEIKEKIDTDNQVKSRILEKYKLFLRDYPWSSTRSRGLNVISLIPTAQANNILLSDLLTSSSDKDVLVASMLTERNDRRAVKPIFEKLVSSNKSGSQNETLSTLLALLAPAEFAATQREWWPYLAARCEPEFLAQYAKIDHLTSAQRVAMARLLGQREEPCSMQLLRLLTGDASVLVRAAAARALGVLHTHPQLADLHSLLRDPSVNVQHAAAEALVKVAGPESVAPIRAQVLNPDTPLYVVVPLLFALGHAGTPDAAAVLLQAAQLYEHTIARHAYRALGDMRLKQVVPQLKQRLTWYEQQVASWRAYRDRIPNDRQVKEAPPQSGPRHPDSFALAELVTTLARLAEPTEVIPLLGHDLADVRQAAALGLAARGLPDLLEQLDAQRAVSTDPLFRHAAYRAIDMSLDVLELVGSNDDLQKLQRLHDSGRIQDRDGVLGRVAWTINELLHGPHS